MPKKDIEYSKCVIYKIVCQDLSITDIYVGNTTEFIKRKYTHKRNCINEDSPQYNLNIYKCMRDNGGWDNRAMYEIEKFPCNDSNEARSRERYWYEELKANLNMRTSQKEKVNKKFKEAEDKIHYKPIKYKYPDYYKNCNTRDSFDKMCELNKQYHEKQLKIID